MNLSDFDYDLPLESIAQRPLGERDASRMLLLDRVSGQFQDGRFREFSALLRGDELIVVNNARVLPGRLFGHRTGIRAEAASANDRARNEFLSAPIEVLLVRPLGSNRWEALVRPGRKIRVGERIVFAGDDLEAVVESRGEYGIRVLRFASKGDFYETMVRFGHIPLPPYIKRDDEPADRERYQTVYAKQGMAAAAPTAGLHFTPEVLASVRARGVEIAEITLDVGLGTFEPVRTDRLEDHKIHTETYEISDLAASAIERARSAHRPILAIGTTAVRALEDAIAKPDSKGIIAPGKYQADIFLYPGKPFHVVTQLLTNFHLPRSTLLALVAAFAGRESVLRAYRHAAESSYRFYSYGDCMLIR
ncbi:MAG: tRNA preQ1(34) S-adenosylmethionine ribosyltransferase-isomerase QueA [Candidatus Acidiferrales bacterium]